MSTKKKAKSPFSLGEKIIGPTQRQQLRGGSDATQRSIASLVSLIIAAAAALVGGVLIFDPHTGVSDLPQLFEDVFFFRRAPATARTLMRMHNARTRLSCNTRVASSL